MEDKKKRAPAFGLALATFGLSFCLGPVSGSYLAKQFGDKSVFLTSFVLVLVNISYIVFFLPETVKVQVPADVSTYAQVFINSAQLSIDELQTCLNTVDLLVFNVSIILCFHFLIYLLRAFCFISVLLCYIIFHRIIVHHLALCSLLLSALLSSVFLRHLKLFFVLFNHPFHFLLPFPTSITYSLPHHIYNALPFHVTLPPHQSTMKVALEYLPHTWNFQETFRIFR